jgi:hypothetical protein
MVADWGSKGVEGYVRMNRGGMSFGQVVCTDGRTGVAFVDEGRLEGRKCSHDRRRGSFERYRG